MTNISNTVLEELQNFLDAQDALDNHELNGINAEDYFVLMYKRNDARKHLDAALASLQVATKRIDSTAFRRGQRAFKSGKSNPYNGPELRDEPMPDERKTAASWHKLKHLLP